MCHIIMSKWCIIRNVDEYMESFFTTANKSDYFSFIIGTCIFSMFHLWCIDWTEKERKCRALLEFLKSLEIPHRSGTKESVFSRSCSEVGHKTQDNRATICRWLTFSNSCCAGHCPVKTKHFKVSVYMIKSIRNKYVYLCKLIQVQI